MTKISKLVTFHQWKSFLYIIVLRPWTSQPPGTLPVDMHSPKQMSLIVAEINGLHSQQVDAILDQAVGGIKSQIQKALRKTVLLATLFLTHQWPSKDWYFSWSQLSQNWHKRCACPHVKRSVTYRALISDTVNPKHFLFLYTRMHEHRCIHPQICFLCKTK